jgi:hypothetical protein
VPKYHLKSFAAAKKVKHVVNGGVETVVSENLKLEFGADIG